MVVMNVVLYCQIGILHRQLLFQKLIHSPWICLPLDILHYLADEEAEELVIPRLVSCNAVCILNQR